VTRVAHLSWLLSPAGGGIPGVVFALAREQRSHGLDVGVLGVADKAPPLGEASVARPFGPRSLGFAPGMRVALEARASDLVHLHGLFTWPSHVARSFGRRTRRPVVVSPHGMLEPWALARSAWKKRLFRLLVEDDNLRRAACLHALCAPEAAGFRRLGLPNAVAVVPNGVDLPGPGDGGRAFRGAFPIAEGRRILLFLGRVHPKKGLPHLVDAWAEVMRDRPALREWLLLVAGPDQLGHAAEIVRRAAERGVGDDVRFTGPLDGTLKDSALAAASAFVLPSFSEGFSVAVLEAMAARLPVLVTRQCNLDVEAFGGGILAEPDAVSVARQLHELLDLSEADRRAMGERGRREVEAKYTWPRVARDLADVYAWTLGRGPRPAFVEGGS
jgi:poly(glycerol-phosphate) alpha-glucosyltransferase